MTNVRQTCRPSRVVTFHSATGGVGRSMALANVAYRLADAHGLRVVAVDFDLDSPSLTHFFGVPPERTAGVNGVLDYLVAWRDAVLREDEGPPAEVERVAESLLRVDVGPFAPKAGALSVLRAREVIGGVDLVDFDWTKFYGEQGGALSVEKLREGLLVDADVVLVDGPCGFGDVAGICSIQLPDGLVLMAGPNAPSIKGIEVAARSSARASAVDRAERGPTRTWLSIARLPSDEGDGCAAHWLNDHEAWFKRGVDGGLWSAEDHPSGIQSFILHQVSRWGVGTPLLTEETSGPGELLARDYDRLTAALAMWWSEGLPERLLPAGAT